LQIFDDVEEGIHTSSRREQTLPMGEEACEGLLLDRLDFFAKAGEGLAADDAQDLGIAPFAMKAARTEAAFNDAVFCNEMIEGLLGLRGIERESVGYFVERERAVGASVAANEFDDRLGYRFEQGRWDAGWEWGAKAVTIAGCVFDGDDALFAGDAELKKATGADQSVHKFEDFRRGDSQREFFASEVTEAKQKIVKAVGITSAERIYEALLLGFDLFHRFAVEELAEVGFT
jgi:hypothetical protein